MRIFRSVFSLDVKIVLVEANIFDSRRAVGLHAVSHPAETNQVRKCKSADNLEQNYYLQLFNFFQSFK